MKALDLYFYILAFILQEKVGRERYSSFNFRVSWVLIRNMAHMIRELLSNVSNGVVGANYCIGLDWI